MVVLVVVVLSVRPQDQRIPWLSNGVEGPGIVFSPWGCTAWWIFRRVWGWA